MFKKLRRRSSTGDISGGKDAKEEAKKNNENRNEDIIRRSNSFDSGKKRFFKSPTFKRKKKNSLSDISEAELISSTYSGSPEPLSTFRRKRITTESIPEETITTTESQLDQAVPGDESIDGKKRVSLTPFEIIELKRLLESLTGKYYEIQFFVKKQLYRNAVLPESQGRKSWYIPF